MSIKQARIVGIGSYLPKRVMTNQDLEKIVDTSDEWIVTRTGMKERRIAAEDEFASDMGAKAAQKALSDCGKSVADLDMILVATSTPDYLFPSTAALIQNQLGAKEIPCLDMQAACTGMLYALSIAKAYVENGAYKNVLVIASEKLSSFTNYKDRATCVLFGDGAAAAVVSGEGKGFLINPVCLGADGKEQDLLKVRAGGSRNPTSAKTVEEDMHFIEMQGKEVFKHAVRRMESAAIKSLEAAGMEESDLNWVVPHQANDRIIGAIAKRFKMSDEKVYRTVHKYGNTSASSVGIAFDELRREHEIADQENILLVAFGAGFTWGATILTKGE
ncbi:MAG: 3-oxoacyl-[acyl-carrier-protein] synthase 3 [Chlamydiales bacterium]|nr:3-oxoacyl-[acyl-carrier-protein] synthase 3 [Chlamydiales bacterium]MCH9636130.1 3-oxoacyl-[acyl-carrier-protein] synthase 3 [Chlamydiales bacterium]